MNKILNTKEGAYFLGFLWGDGIIRNNTIKITINEIDAVEIKRILIYIFDDLLIERKINIYDNPFNKEFKNAKNQVEFKIHNKNLATNLKLYGYDLKHTGISCNNIMLNIKFIDHFIRGIIDSDGCIGDNRSGKSIQVVSTIHQDWSYMIDYCKIININKYILSKSIAHNGKSKWSGFTLRRTDDILCFLKKIYDLDNEYDNIGLSRKYQKAILILERYKEIDTKNGIFKKWDDLELNFLIENFQKMKYSEISKVINRTVPSIKEKIKYLKLKKNRVYKNSWNNDEINFLIENYSKYGCKFCSEYLNKTKSSIYGAVNKFNLKRIY